MKKKTETSKSRTKKVVEKPIEEINIENAPAESEVELKSEGLGDLIKKATTALGLTQCEPCKKRQERFNKMFRWLYPTRLFTQDEINMIDEINRTKKVTDAKTFFRLYNEIFNSKLEGCSCPGLVKQMVARLTNWREEQQTLEDDAKENN